MSDHRPWLRLRAGRRAALRRELEEELEAHLDMRVEELVASGMTEANARQEAERRFGDLAAARRQLYASARRRERRLLWGRLAGDVDRDLRLALRRMLRSPGYAAVSIAIFGLGIALTTIMFTVVDHVLLRPLPFPDPDRLVSLQSVGEPGEPFNWVSMANWYDWRAGATTLSATAIVRQDRLSVVEGDDAFRVTGAAVGGAFFDVLRPTFAAGRALTEEDGQAIRLLTVLSAPFATRRFGSAEQAIGRSLTVAGRPYEIVGVVAKGQEFPEGTEVWVAFHVDPGSGGARQNINFQAVARLRADADVARTRDELDGIARGIRETDPDGAVYSHGVGVVPLQDVVVSAAADELWMLMVAVAGVLLAACANLAGLGLARARRRTPEIALRMALGSGRGRVLRQVLIEHLVLALLGGLVGLALAWVGGSLLFSGLGRVLPRADSISLDVRVAFFAAVISIASGLFAGVVPALFASKSGAPTGVRGTIRGGRGLPGGGLVAMEVALTLALLIGGGLLVRSLRSVLSRDLGYEPEGVVIAEIQLTGPQYRDRDGSLAAAYWGPLLDRLAHTAGVASAAIAHVIPTGPGATGFISFPDRPDPDFGAGYRVVSDDYFDALGISLLAGRTFDSTDDLGSERVALVNRALAKRAWPGRDPIGQRVRATSMEDFLYDDGAPWLTVIGVVESVRHDGYTDDMDPEMYVLYRQVPRWSGMMNVVVRGRPGTEANLAAAVRDAVHSSDPALAVEPAPLDERVTDLLRERVVIMRLLTGFALTALLLTCLGIYGLVSHAASLQTRELAVRAALGASRSGLLAHMLAGAGRVVALGAAVGLLAAYGATGLLDSLVVDVSTTDPLTYAGAAALLVCVALIAALVPSVRAARLDPVETLRSE